MVFSCTRSAAATLLFALWGASHSRQNRTAAGGRQWLFLEYVERGAGEPAAVERVHERPFVDERTAAVLIRKAVGLIDRERARVHQVTGRRFSVQLG